MRSWNSLFFDEATKIPALVGASFGGVTGILSGIGNYGYSVPGSIFSRGFLIATVSPFSLGAIIGVVCGGLLGFLIWVAIPEFDSL